MAVYGLLVGVNYYRNPDIRGLGGCVNDVYLFSQTLQERFNIPEHNLQILTDQNATHNGVIGEFRQHLIQRTWQPDDSAIFYFSGHGAQTLAPEVFWDIEPDHLNESLVCHDSRTLDTPDLLDKELRFLIAELATAGCQNITAILDCCHGGHGTRFVGESAEEVRLAPTDMTQYPLECFVFGQQAGKSVDQLALKNLIPDSRKHILLSGCHDYQLSIEKLQGSYGSAQRHGLFTYAMCETLSALQYPISYQELRNRIHQKVQSQANSQSPQIEAIAGADVSQTVFGTDLQPLRMLAFKGKAGNWQLNAGAMQGLNTGDEIALFSNDADTSQLHTNLTKARIQEASSFQSTLAIVDSSKLVDTQYTAIITRQNFPKLSVTLEGDASSLQTLRNLLQTNDTSADPGRFLQESSQNARYAVRCRNGDYYVTQASDTRPLFQSSKNATEALEQAAVMARWHQKLALQNVSSRLDDPVEMVITYNGTEYINQDVTLAYTFDGAKWEKPRFNLELRLKAGQPRLYYALLYFDGSTGEISNVLASGGWLGHEGFEEEGKIKAQPKVKAYEGKAIPLKIKDELLAQGITRIQDSLKLMVCEQEFDSSLLNQQPLKLQETKGAQRSLLKNSLERFADDAHHRSLDLDEEPDAAPDWTSKVINISVVRPQETRAISATNATILLGAGDVRIEPHSAFQGQARLVSSQPATRHLGQAKTPEPALLSDTRHAFSFSEGRGTDLGLDTLEIFLTGDTQTVSPQNPLKLSINQPLPEGEQIIPYAYDQENNLFLPLGSATQGKDGRTHIYIADLPATAAQTPADATKSIGSALKIFFRKLVYRDLLRLDVEMQVLGTPRFAPNDPAQVDGYETDPQTITALVAQANKILLITHGIIGHTQTIAGCVNLPHTEGQPTIGSHYDLILTFDYENLNTPIETNAKALKNLLARVGIHAKGGKRIDILAHSMGGLVARYLIEYEGGDQLVNTLVMAGTPNGGSPLATLKQHGFTALHTWVYGNLVAILNGVTTAYVGGAAIAALMKLLDAVDNTLDQMAADSELIQRLEQSPAPSNVRYAVIAGDTQGLMIPPDHYTERLGKLLEYLGKRLKLAAYDLLTDKLFKEANDMAVGYASMKQFNAEWRNGVAVEAVRCDHLSYFADKETVRRIAQHLQG
ncbi:caspase family protein [Thiothrix sp.]|jgi:pimeloyl-ACP methyl ester carboxylesterase|uniref:caspase family protein n=1 Tax=Thiothrix sp. TaxID=1032 RepID=UPI00257C3C0E|nr:caspase family protein [Thiothrix sp.]